MEPSILFEDENIIVINKPAGITVNRSDTTKEEITVQDWVEKEFSSKNLELKTSDVESDFYKRSGIVHRLDKETSGILLVAKNQNAFLNLQSQFKDRTVKKTNLALVHGIFEPEEGEVRAPVGRLPWNRRRFGILPGGKEAATKYKTVSKFKFNPTGETLTLLELYPETGRTHQIRVHAKYMNHPIFSDSLYAGRKTARNDRSFLPRVFLHASKISFADPVKGEPLSFEAPIPKNLSEFLKQYCNKIL